MSNEHARLAKVSVILAAAMVFSVAARAGEPPKFGKAQHLMGSEITCAVGQFGCGVAVTDWDGDGFRDFVAANGEGDIFVVPCDPRNALDIPDAKSRLRLGGVTMIGHIPSKYPGADPVILEIADKNGDGKADLVLRDRFGQDWLLLRVTDTGLGEPQALGEPHKDWKRGSDYPRVSVKDTQEEVVGRPGRFEVRSGKDNVYFEGARGFAWHGRMGYDPSLAVVDLDGDGLPDLLTVAFARSPGRTPRSVLFHKANRPPKPGLFFSEGIEVFRDAEVHNVVAAGDLDGDGRVDLVLSRMGFWVVWNEGTKTEPKFTKKVKVEGVADEESVSLVDWDGDGLLDVVSTRWHGEDRKSHLSFYRNLGKKAPEIAFDKPEEILIGGKPISMLSAGMCVVDFDGDGDLDLVFCPYGGEVVWAENVAGKGKPPVFESLRPVTCEDGPIRFGSRNNAIRVADINGDGKLDILITSEYGDFDTGKEVCVWYGK